MQVKIADAVYHLREAVGRAVLRLSDDGQHQQALEIIKSIEARLEELERLTGSQ